MKLTLQQPAKALSKAYLKQSLKREQIEQFKANLVRLFDRIREEEHEEHLKNIVADFLKDTWYKPAFEINTSKRADLVIHNGKSSADSVGVIIETKKPTNKNEMISPERPNAKALHELLHYYMQERYIKGNQEIKRLIVCNIYEWYIFDAADFERFFFGNRSLVKSYKDWNEGLLVSANTDWFYQEVARPFIDKELEELPCVCFDLRDFEKIARNPDKSDDRKLINLYKLLSPANLLKQPFANDSNSLNKEFYHELLHIIGLEEVKEKGKKLIRRKAAGARNDGSLLENTVNFITTRGRLAAVANAGQYILPHKFFNAQYGESLRSLVVEGKNISEIVHFGHEMIFDEAAAYTCLLILNKERSEQFRFVKVDNVIGWRNGQPSAFTEGVLPAPTLPGADWNFDVGNGNSLLQRLTSLPLTLEQCTERIFQGLKTSADKIYIVEEVSRDNETILVFSPEKKEEYRLEPGLLHPLVKGGDSSAYRLSKTNRLILFPYEAGVDGKVVLVAAEQLQERYPKTWAYLRTNREYLEGRENGKMRHAGWYGYVYPKALDVISLSKIFTPDLAPSPRFSLDVSGEYFFTGGAAGGYGILVNSEHDRSYILGILNSRVSGWFIEQTATQMRGGWRSYEARFIKHIPIPTATPDQQAPIVERVEKLLADPTGPDVPRLEAEIDRLVYALYNLTEEEIAVVEGKK